MTCHSTDVVVANVRPFAEIADESRYVYEHAPTCATTNPSCASAGEHDTELPRGSPGSNPIDSGTAVTVTHTEPAEAVIEIDPRFVTRNSAGTRTYAHPNSGSRFRNDTAGSGICARADDVTAGNRSHTVTCGTTAATGSPTAAGSPHSRTANHGYPACSSSRGFKPHGAENHHGSGSAGPEGCCADDPPDEPCCFGAPPAPPPCAWGL